MLLYNQAFIRQQDLKLPINNRAFQYNDGFFETIIVIDGKLRFWQDHQERMQEAAATLQLATPAFFWNGELEAKLLQLAELQAASAFGRLKLKVWRTGGGLYTPQTNDVEWLAMAESAQPMLNTNIGIGICQTVKTCFSLLSHFKGPHAPLYVLAGIEKQTKGFDDMVLLNTEGYVAELISANIFWQKNGLLFTPALETGCVNGILRRNILRWCHQQGIEVHETLDRPEELLQADCVIAANVTGIRSITRLDEQIFNSNSDLLASIRKGLKL